MTEPREPKLSRSEHIARAFHMTYEALAPAYGWKSQESCQVEWDDLPEANRTLMLAVVDNLLLAGTIQ